MILLPNRHGLLPNRFFLLWWVDGEKQQLCFSLFPQSAFAYSSAFYLLHALLREL
jgi:hypothetical protein